MVVDLHKPSNWYKNISGVKNKKKLKFRPCLQSIFTVHWQKKKKKKFNIWQQMDLYYKHTAHPHSEEDGEGGGKKNKYPSFIIAQFCA